MIIKSLYRVVFIFDKREVYNVVVTLAFWETALRISLAALCGGIIGLERGRKNRPAGFRTYMIVCMGAALTMVLSAYLCAMLSSVWTVGLTDGTKTDMSRFGAQVINGIGFLGAGTILVTGRQQVKGMTTAAGLWASACMGLTIGAGFYSAAIICCLLIVTTIVFFSKIEHFVVSHSRIVDIYVEFENTDDIAEILSSLKNIGIRIFDVEITKAKDSETKRAYAIISMQLPKKTPHTVIFTSLSAIENVRAIEEL